MGLHGVSWWDDHASMPRVSSGKRPGVDSMEWWYASTIPPRPPSKPPIVCASGRAPGTWQPASVRRSSRPSTRGRGPIRAGSGTRSSMTWSRDPDMPRRAPADRLPGLLAGTSAHFYGVAAACVRRHRRALQRLAHGRATRGAQAGAPRDAGTAQAAARVPTTRTGGACHAQPGAFRVTTPGSRCRGNDGLPTMIVM